MKCTCEHQGLFSYHYRSCHHLKSYFLILIFPYCFSHQPHFLVLLIVQSHRGSSPQIRTFAPDGKTTSLPSDHGILHISRSPSPMRAISLDARCSSPANSIDPCDLRTPSPSQNSLVSLFGNNNLTCLSPKVGGRCLSPLLIPPRTPAGIEAASIGPASPLGTLQLDLYTRQEGPLYINVPENATSLGRLHLRVKYDSHLCDLTIHLIEGSFLIT